MGYSTTLYPISLLFVDDNNSWTEAHANFVASFFGYSFCSIDPWQYTNVMDAIYMDWVLSIQPPPTTVLGSNLTNLVTTLTYDNITARPNNYIYQGQYGSTILARVFLDKITNIVENLGLNAARGSYFEQISLRPLRFNLDFTPNYQIRE